MPTHVVTGASSGIGRATAAALADRGATVFAIARSADALGQLATIHSGVVPVVADLATDEGIAELVAATLDFERIDGLVHAAGSMVPVEPYDQIDADALTEHFRIHVATPIEINQRLHEQLRGGRVLYVDSYSAAAPRHGWSAYSIVKAGAQMAARAAHDELDGVDVVRLFPGGVRTPLVEAVLAAPDTSAAAQAFRQYDSDGDIVEPDAVGEWIAGIALDIPASALRAQECWDYAKQEADENAELVGLAGARTHQFQRFSECALRDTTRTPTSPGDSMTPLTESRRLVGGFQGSPQQGKHVLWSS